MGHAKLEGSAQEDDLNEAPICVNNLLVELAKRKRKCTSKAMMLMVPGGPQRPQDGNMTRQQGSVAQAGRIQRSGPRRGPSDTEHPNELTPQEAGSEWREH